MNISNNNSANGHQQCINNQQQACFTQNNNTHRWHCTHVTHNITVIATIMYITATGRYTFIITIRITLHHYYYCHCHWLQNIFHIRHYRPLLYCYADAIFADTTDIIFIVAAFHYIDIFAFHYDISRHYYAAIYITPHFHFTRISPYQYHQYHWSSSSSSVIITSEYHFVIITTHHCISWCGCCKMVILPHYASLHIINVRIVGRQSMQYHDTHTITSSMCQY